MDKSNRSKLDLLAHEVLAWRRQGKSYRSIEKILKEEYGLTLSYRTVQAWLSKNHPELTEDQDTAPPDEDDEDNIAASSREQEDAERVQPPLQPARDPALRAELEDLLKKLRALEGRSATKDVENRILQGKIAAQEAEIIALTEQRPAQEAQPMSSPGLPVPVYRGSWEDGMHFLPGEPIDITPGSSRRVLTLGVSIALLALGVFVFYTVFQDTLTRAYTTAKHAYVTVMHFHGPFALLEASLVISGLGLGLRIKALVPALLALVTYLLMLRDAHLPFFIALMLTIQVSKALVQGR